MHCIAVRAATSVPDAVFLRGDIPPSPFSLPRALQTVFSVCPLSVSEWFAVLKMSIPVIILDETMKFIARKFIDGTQYYFELSLLISTWVGFLAIVLCSPL